jgi:hypothetical protein
MKTARADYIPGPDEADAYADAQGNGNDDGWTEPPHVDTHPESEARPKLTLRTPGEVLDLRFDDSDRIIGPWLAALGQSCAWSGAGGLGKSRLLEQAAACVTTGRKFLAFDTWRPDLRWLFLQTENSNRRLQQDLLALKSWLGSDWPLFAEKVVFHTLENDTDGLVSLDRPENQAAIEQAIAESRPNIVVGDPLTDLAIGDLNKDVDMRLTLTTFARVCRKGDPTRSLQVLHHALTGKAGAARATGFDRSSFARNSKVLFGWTRAQVNIAPVDPDSNERLIIACGKLSNAKEFPPFAIRLNPETMIYECDPSVNVQEWAACVTAKTPPRPRPTIEDFLGLFRESDNPRECLLSAVQLREQFQRRNWDRDAAPALRDDAEAAGKLAIWNGPHNTKLCGLPPMVAAWERKLAEKGTLLGEVPLPTTPQMKPKRKAKKCRK